MLDDEIWQEFARRVGQDANLHTATYEAVMKIIAAMRADADRRVEAMREECALTAEDYAGPRVGRAIRALPEEPKP